MRIRVRSRHGAGAIVLAVDGIDGKSEAALYHLGLQIFGDVAHDRGKRPHIVGPGVVLDHHHLRKLRQQCVLESNLPSGNTANVGPIHEILAVCFAGLAHAPQIGLERAARGFVIRAGEDADRIPPYPVAFDGVMQQPVHLRQVGKDRFGQRATALLDRRIETGQLALAVVILANHLGRERRRCKGLVKEVDVKSVAFEFVHQVAKRGQFVAIHCHTVFSQREGDGLAAIMGAVRWGEGD